MCFWCQNSLEVVHKFELIVQTFHCSLPEFARHLLKRRMNLLLWVISTWSRKFKGRWHWWSFDQFSPPYSINKKPQETIAITTSASPNRWSILLVVSSVPSVTSARQQVELSSLKMLQLLEVDTRSGQTLFAPKTDRQSLIIQ